VALFDSYSGRTMRRNVRAPASPAPVARRATEPLRFACAPALTAALRLSRRS
jgi:hypothetical protein